MRLAHRWLLGAYFRLRLGWPANAHRRVAPQTAITRSLDFGNDHSSPFKTFPRTYAIRNPARGQAFAAMNAELNAVRLGAEQRRREQRNLWIGVIIFCVIALLAWYLR